MISQSKTVRRFLSLTTLLLALLITAVPVAPRQRQLPAPKAHPLLLELARQQPEQMVSVIVQQQSADAAVEQQMAALGGRVTLDLHLINAFAAELPAQAVPTLARAEGVRWVSLNAPMAEAGKPPKDDDGGGGGKEKDDGSSTTCSDCIDTSKLHNEYIQIIGADRLWNEAPYLQGQGMTVAVVDSGIEGQHADLKDATTQSRVVVSYKTSSTATTGSDKHGHGTHIAGIIGGNGASSTGSYIGVAPKINLVNVKVSDDEGSATAADVVAGLQWIYENKDLYNIRVVNLSLNSTVSESYHNSPLDAAVEILWFNSIVVVASAGNTGTADLYPPANDPFIITVGAMNDQKTVKIRDDTLADFSAHGITVDGFSKPELVAPGVKIQSLLASDSCWIALNYPNYLDPNGPYFRMSGTSMAAPMVAASAALLLQDEPNLTPDQVKYRLMATTTSLRNMEGVGAGYVNVYNAVHGTTTESANTGIEVSQLLTTGDDPATWDSTTWNSVNWGTVNWGSVNWGSVNWGSVNWGSTYWGQ